FTARDLLSKSSRRMKVDWLHRQYENVCKRTGNWRPSIVAHSFGTYMIARAIRIYGLKFDRVIFCGAIVRLSYPRAWATASEKVGAVLNDFGRQDFWAWVAGFVVEDAGGSGYRGFTDDAKGQVVQIEHKEFRHGDYFFLTNYRESWIPFLQGNPQTVME